MLPKIYTNNITSNIVIQKNGKLSGEHLLTNSNQVPEILFISSYPPRECGIATYCQDLIKALNDKFNHSFIISICALETDTEKYSYSNEIKYLLNTDIPGAFMQMAKVINENTSIEMILIQHEFGLFQKNEDQFTLFLQMLTKPVLVAFHTVLPRPHPALLDSVKEIARLAESIIVMTNSSADILTDAYEIAVEKITVIAHGTHLVPHLDKTLLKSKYKLNGKKVLSTFGLLSSGKSIETTLDALPAIVKKNPEVMFLIIGKTHPSVFKREGEAYRQLLETKVQLLGLELHVQFINQFLPLSDLLEYLQLTDIYLFTSRDPNQAVSGTFSYAISCGCPVISTPIPHALEVLKNGAGIIVDFGNKEHLSKAVNKLLKNELLRKNISSNGLHRMASTAWENAAIAHAMLFKEAGKEKLTLHYTLPVINLDHIKKLTTEFGMIQFSKLNQPDISSGYTLDDNARAMIAMCQHYELSNNEEDVEYINRYYLFIKHCLQKDGYFLNYVNEQKNYTAQNYSTNLADSNGRAIWALGYLISLDELLPKKIISDATITLELAIQNSTQIHSTRAMAFIIKGLYYYNIKNKTTTNLSLIEILAKRLVQMYKHEADKEWGWFESYLTYANSILPEAMLCAWLATGEPVYKEIAKKSFDFLLSRIFGETRIQVISNKNWLQRGRETISETIGGEQPIDVAYTILALHKFYEVFKDPAYLHKMQIGITWFLGNNHLQQIIYNPCTGGCYDGLEENYVNLNQGAESTVSYLMARLTVEKIYTYKRKIRTSEKKEPKKGYTHYLANNQV